MKFCMPHWDKLKACCTSRGMDHLIHRSGEAATEATLREARGEGTPQDFDPLLSATWMAYGQAVELGGLGMMCSDEQGNERCPICEAVKNTPAPAQETEHHWTEKLMDAVLDQARDRGLMPRPA